MFLKNSIVSDIKIIISKNCMLWSNCKMPPTLEVLYDPPQTVSMCSNEHPLSFFDFWGNLLIPVWQRPCNGVFKALAGRELVLSQVCIATILWWGQSQCVKMWQTKVECKKMGSLVFNSLSQSEKEIMWIQLLQLIYLHRLLIFLCTLTELWTEIQEASLSVIY